MSFPGSGFTDLEVISALKVLAVRRIAAKEVREILQPWFEAACGAANNGSNANARATTLQAKMAAAGSSLSVAQVQILVEAYDEALYDSAPFAPSAVLKVLGPMPLAIS